MYNVSRSLLYSPEDCADAIQEALLRAWKKLPGLRNPDVFEAWIIRILINECNRLGRNYQTHTTEPFSGKQEVSQGVQHDLRFALDALPEKQRLILTLHHMLGYSIDETAAILHLPQGTVKSRLSRARHALLAELEGSHEHK